MKGLGKMVYQSKYNDKISIFIKKIINLTRENKLTWKQIDKIDESNKIIDEYMNTEKKFISKQSTKRSILKEKSYYTFVNNGYIYLFTCINKNKEIDYYIIGTQTKAKSNLVELTKGDNINEKHQELIESLIFLIEDNDVDDFINSILVME